MNKTSKKAKKLIAAAAALCMTSAGFGLGALSAYADDGTVVSEGQEQYAEGSLEGCTVKLTQTAFNFTGEAVTPEKYLSISDGTTPLVKDKDYTVSYKNNDKPGAAQMTVTGIGKYNSSVKLTFIIRPAKNNAAVL